MHPELLQRTSVDSRWSFSSSVALHLLVVLVVFGVSYLVIEAVQDPRTTIEFSDFAAPPSPPPPPPPAAGSASSVLQIEKRLEQPPEEMLQPDTLPEQLLVPPDASSSSGVDDGQPDGLLGGVHGGDRNGTLGGVLISDRPSGVLGGGSFAPIVLTPDMVPPVLIRKVEPAYPDIARAARVQGRVVLQAVIDAHGEVDEVTILGSSSPLLEAASLDAVRQWKYKPALQNGRPVPVYFTVVVEFTLR